MSHHILSILMIQTIIRAYEPKDLTEIVKLWYKTWHNSFPDLKHPQAYEQWEERFRDELVRRGEVWIAQIASQIVGFFVIFEVKGGSRRQKLSVNTAGLSNTKGELNQFFVDPAHQNQGIGTALIDKAKEICPQGIRLKTLQSNTKACLFYTKHRFVAGEQSTNKINGQPNIEYTWLPLKSDY